MSGQALQAMIDGMGMAAQHVRASKQMTLGEMIKHLEGLPPQKKINGLGELNSYRGYYVDLSFEPTNEVETVKSLMRRCKDAMGQVFIGYKGGDYVMGANTPLWLACYGDCGVKIVSMLDDGNVETAEDDHDGW